MRLSRTLLAGSALALLLSGCSEFQDATRQEKDFLHTSDTSHVPAVGDGLITVSDRPYLLGDIVPETDVVPDALSVHAVLSIPRAVSLREAVAQASMRTGVPARVLPDADDADDEIMPSAGLAFNGVTLPAPPVPSGQGRTTHHASAWAGRGAWFEYEGTAGGEFSALAARFGVNQRWTGHEIEFYRNLTKTYVVPAFDKKITEFLSVAGVTGGGSGSSSGSGMNGMSGSSGGSSGMGSGSNSGSGSGQSQGVAGVTENGTIDQWKNIQAAALQAGNGARIVADPGLGILTVTGSPEQLASFDSWYDSLRSVLMKQVAVTIHVFSVKLNRESNYGFSPQIAATEFGKYFAATTTPTALPNIQSSQVPFSFGASIIKGRMTGTNLAVQALQSMKNVTELYERGGITTNGVPAPFQHGENTTYIQNASSYLATNAGSSASISPGVVMSGFEGSFVPRVIPDNHGDQIMLNLHFVIQTLLSMDNLSGNNSVSIQGPKTDGTTMGERVILHNGDALVLSGFVGDSTGQQRNGVGSPLFWLLGGGGDANNTKDRVVITVEAHTL